MKPLSIVLLIVGGLCLLLSLAALVITFIVMATSDGRIEPDEAAPAFIVEGLCCSLSFLVFLVGGVMLLVAMSKKK